MAHPPYPIDPESEAQDTPTQEDVPYVDLRLRIVYWLFCAILLVFLTAMFKFMILMGPQYRTDAENNFTCEIPMAAPRGRVVDRNGLPLAVTQTLFNVEMTPYRLSPDDIQSTVDEVANLTGRASVRDKIPELVSLRKIWRSVTLIEGLSLDQILPVLEQNFRLSGIQVTPQYQRLYPAGAAAAFVTGYVRSIAPEDIESYRARGYLASEKVGKLAAELTFEPVLHGVPGVELVKRDARMRPRERILRRPARPGHTLELTLDSGLQALADSLLEGWQGAIVAMDPRDGAVLAMASRPNFDPSRPWEGSQYNKISRGLFAPGSTFKIVTSAAGLDAGISPERTIECDRAYYLPGVNRPFLCSSKWGHGPQNLHEALMHSCNIFFYRWAQEAGAKRMAAMSRAFGFGDRTGFELVLPTQEDPGHVADPDQERIHLGSILQMGIGQGQMIATTPLQIARAYAALCNGGTLLEPRILKQVLSAEGQPVESIQTADGRTIEPGKPVAQGRLPINEEQRKRILAGLWDVTHDPTGTGRHGKFPDQWRVAGKTGTAQTGGKNINALFACFAPFENPEILIVVLIEDALGHGGEVASPLARQMLAYYYGQPEPVVPPSHTPPPEPGED